MHGEGGGYRRRRGKGKQAGYGIYLDIPEAWTTWSKKFSRLDSEDHLLFAFNHDFAKNLVGAHH
jgi:hypothetical protein